MLSTFQHYRGRIFIRALLIHTIKIHPLLSFCIIWSPMNRIITHNLLHNLCRKIIIWYDMIIITIVLDLTISDLLICLLKNWQLARRLQRRIKFSQEVQDLWFLRKTSFFANHISTLIISLRSFFKLGSSSCPFFAFTVFFFLHRGVSPHEETAWDFYLSSCTTATGPWSC